MGTQLMGGLTICVMIASMDNFMICVMMDITVSKMVCVHTLASG